MRVLRSKEILKTRLKNRPPWSVKQRRRRLPWMSQRVSLWSTPWDSPSCAVDNKKLSSKPTLTRKNLNNPSASQPARLMLSKSSSRIAGPRLKGSPSLKRIWRLRSNKKRQRGKELQLSKKKPPLRPSPPTRDFKKSNLKMRSQSANLSQPLRNARVS